MSRTQPVREVGGSRNTSGLDYSMYAVRLGFVLTCLDTLDHVLDWLKKFCLLHPSFAADEHSDKATLLTRDGLILLPSESDSACVFLSQLGIDMCAAW